MKLYEIILITPKGVKESKGIYSAKEAVMMNIKIKKELIAIYGSYISYAFKIDICEVEV